MVPLNMGANGRNSEARALRQHQRIEIPNANELQLISTYFGLKSSNWQPESPISTALSFHVLFVAGFPLSLGFHVCREVSSLAPRRQSVLPIRAN
jgi:hypothetical protein